MAIEILTAVTAAVAAQVYLSPIPEVKTVKVVKAYFAANCALVLYLLFSKSHSSSYLTDVITSCISLNLAFDLTAIILTAIRRFYFSPLSKFPGPNLAAITKLWEANEFRLGHGARTHKRLHQQYGSDFVRIGPNEVSIDNVDAVAKIFAGKYTRGTFYEVGAMNGEFNLNTTRDNSKHTPWRRIWERAFVSSEFKDYNARVEHHVAKTIKILRAAAESNPDINFSKIMDNLVFDIMADLSFSNDAGMQDGTGDGSYMDFIHKYISVLGVVGNLRNLCQLLLSLPETSEVKEFRLKGERMLAERQKLGDTKKDIFRHFLSQDAESGARFTQAELNSNANLIIVAGADTTSSTLAQTFRVLAKYPSILDKLQAEIDGLVANGSEITVDSTRNLPYLNAVVNEALRLLNPVPSGIQATTGTNGVEIAGVYIPGNVQVKIPHLVLMTDERYFPKGDEFIPERWTGERPELLLDRRAFIPFGYGIHSCVGKQLALNEMRLLIASVVNEFDVEFGKSYDEARFEAEWQDYFVLQIGAVHLKFTARL